MDVMTYEDVVRAVDALRANAVKEPIIIAFYNHTAGWGDPEDLVDSISIHAGASRFWVECYPGSRCEVWRWSRRGRWIELIVQDDGEFIDITLTADSMGHVPTLAEADMVARAFVIKTLPRRDRLAHWRRRLDELWPDRGPCGFCDSDDARHRMFDAIITRHWAWGLTIDQLVEEWPHYTREHMVAVLRSGAGGLARNWFRRRRIKRQGRARKRRRGWR